MDLADATLDELRTALAPAIAANAAFDGWNVRALEAAADLLGVDHDIAQLAFSDGPAAMIDAWFAHVDAAMLARFAPEQLAAMKIRARITALVEARLDIVAPQREALRRALAILAMPQNVARGARLGWRAADAMWRAAGDTAIDYNHYTKRMTLGAVYASTVAVFLDDNSDGWADTRAFLSRRIENIMQFERAKAKWLARPEHHFSLSRFVGRLRYPAI
jgi:ubiquinone biosynthesis protein COQ9